MLSALAFDYFLKEIINQSPSRARMRSRSRRRRRRRRRRQRDSGGPCTLRVARSQTVNGTCSRLGTCRHGDKEEFTLVRQLQLNLIKIMRITFRIVDLITEGTAQFSSDLKKNWLDDVTTLVCAGGIKGKSLSWIILTVFCNPQLKNH